MKKLIGTIVGVGIAVLALAQEAQESKNRYAQPELPGDLMIDFGFNIMTDAPPEMGVNFFPSRTFGIYYIQKFKLNDYFTFNAGLGLTAEKLAFEEELNFQEDDDGMISFDTLTDFGSIRSNKLAINYLELPVEFRYYPFRTVDGEGLFVGVGGIFGFRMESHTKVKYTLEQENRVQKLRADFGLSDLRYGLQVRVGLRGIHAFGKLYFSDLFSETPVEGFNPNFWTFGVSISGF
ncbi:MAG: outer membrane beta-barrel protein [Bacteroidota bacterium]